MQLLSFFFLRLFVEKNLWEKKKSKGKEQNLTTTFKPSSYRTARRIFAARPPRRCGAASLCFCCVLADRAPSRQGAKWKR